MVTDLDWMTDFNVENYLKIMQRQQEVVENIIEAMTDDNGSAQ